MSSSVCLRCLARPWTSIPPPATLRVFSTSAPLSANPPKKKAVAAKPTSRQGKTLRLAKGKRTTTGRPPAPGERKAARKRVVLSNTNALEVQGLQDLTDASANVAALEAAQGRVLGFTNESVDALRALEAFKPTQGWSLFRRPASLVRRQTVELARDIERIAAADQPVTVRKVLFGERGSGKSVLLLQSLAVAFLRGWLVLNFPEAKDLTNAHTSYQPDANATYIQPHYASAFLANLARANYNLLSSMRLIRDPKTYNLPIPVQSNISLARFAELGARDPEVAWPVWQALWTELTAPSQPEREGLQRPPVLIGLDGLHYIMRDSAYLNVEAKPIHAHDLATVRQFIQLLSGEAKLANGGLILAATSQSNRASSPTLDHALLRSEARALQQDEMPRWDAYNAIDQRIIDTMETVTAHRVRGLSKEEARGAMEYYAQSGMLRNSVTEGLVSEKWTLSGGGVFGELERGTVGLRF